MTCQETQEFLSAYLDGMLSDQETMTIKEHLAACSSCQRELKALQETIQAVRSLGEVNPPPLFREALRQRLQDEHAKLKPAPAPAKAGRGYARWIPWGAVAAAAAVLLLISITIYQPSDGPLFQAEQMAKSEAEPAQDMAMEMAEAPRVSEEPADRQRVGKEEASVQKAPVEDQQAITGQAEATVQEAELAEAEVGPVPQEELRLFTITGEVGPTPINEGEDGKTTVQLALEVEKIGQFQQQLFSLASEYGTEVKEIGPYRFNLILSENDSDVFLERLEQLGRIAHEQRVLGRFALELQQSRAELADLELRQQELLEAKESAGEDPEKVDADLQALAKRMDQLRKVISDLERKTGQVTISILVNAVKAETE